MTDLSVNWTGDREPVMLQPMPIIEVQCCHCRKTMRIPMLIAQHAYAKMWQERAERYEARMNDLIERCHKKFQSDPMTEWFLEEIIKIRESLNTPWETEGENWESN